MDLSTRFKINSPTVVHETIDNEVVIIEFNTGNYYSLEKTGAEVWETINKGYTLGEIIENILQLYDSTPKEVKEAVGRFIAQLQEENLISVNTTHSIKTEHPPKQSSNSKQPFEIPLLQKYSDMQELLLLDPIHEVDETGWPSAKFVQSQKNTN